MGGETTKFTSKDVALTACFASLYAVLVVSQGISSASLIQLRFADCLIPLSALFGLPAILGVSVGCVIGNAYMSASAPNGIYDILFGPVANLVAATVIFKMRSKAPVGCVIGAISIGVIVGSYLWLLFPPSPSIFGVLLPLEWPVWTISVATITISSLVAIAVLGFMLLKILERPNIIKPLKAKGLVVHY